MAKITLRHGHDVSVQENANSRIHQVDIQPPNGARFTLTPNGLLFEFAKGTEHDLLDWCEMLQDGLLSALQETDSIPKQPKTREELRAQQMVNAEQAAAGLRVQEKARLAAEAERINAENEANRAKATELIRKSSAPPPVAAEAIVDDE